jgi:glycosyltransferase involved in cell wall biosynthesis
MSTFSICIPTYNYANYLPYAIESCLDQDEDFDLVVIDDCSTDSTPSLQDKYSVDPRVKWLRNESKLPIQDTWNKAVHETSGEFVKLLPADDLLMPGSIHRFKEMISTQLEASFHGHLANIIDASGNIVRRHRNFSRSSIISLEGQDALKSKLRQKYRFKEPSCNFFRKSSWEALGGYSRKYRFTFDINFNIKMIGNYKSVLWNEHLVMMRRHASSDGATLPKDLALSDLRITISELNSLIGENQLSFWDKSAANGWLMYRMLELVHQERKKSSVIDTKFILKNIDLFSNPLSFFYAFRLFRNRLLFGDVQQSL